jgi:hypothetical protein
MDELKFKYSDKVSIAIAVFFAALNFLFFIFTYKSIIAYFMLGELPALTISTLFFIAITIFITKPLLKKIIYVTE